MFDRFDQKVFFPWYQTSSYFGVRPENTFDTVNFYLWLSQCGMYFELWKGTCLPTTRYCFWSGKLLASSCEEHAYNLAKDIILVTFLTGNKLRFPCGKSWQKHNRWRGDPTSHGASLLKRCSFKVWMCGRLPLGIPASTLALFWSRI